MNEERRYAVVEKSIKENKYLSTPKNNELLLGFINAKVNGAFGRVVFEKRIRNLKTSIKKCCNIKKIDQYFKKNFYDINEDEMLEYRDLMNSDKIFKNKTIIQWKEKGYKIDETTIPLSYRTKIDYRSNFGEFWKFIMEYYYQENKEEIKKEKLKELPDIMRYFTLQKPEDFEEIVVDFIEDDDILTLLNNIKNKEFKACVQTFLMSGARPCEILKIRYGKQYNLYKNKDGKWIIHLPKIKGVSYKKFPMEIDMYEDELIPYFQNLKLKEGDYIFKITEQTLVKLMNHYTSKYLPKRYTLKILRKTARMIRSNAGYSEQWINKLMGHSPSSRIIGHYVNHGGIKNEDPANERMKAQQYPSLKKDYANMQLKLKAQEENMKAMQDQIAQIVAKENSKKDIEAEIKRKKSKE